MSPPVINLADSDDDDDDLAALAAYKPMFVSTSTTGGTTNTGTTQTQAAYQYGANPSRVSLASPPAVAFMASNNSAKRSAPSVPAASAVAKKKPKKQTKKKADLPHCLIWICTHGKGQSRNWTKNSLRIVGVYSSKDAAEQAKRRVMEQHDCCGHGDILVGGSWDDEIDLVVREAPTFFPTASNEEEEW